MEKRWKYTSENEKNILVVDDCRLTRMMLIAILQQNLHSTIQARDWKEALEMLEEYKSKVNLIILDNQMPKMDGIEVAKKIRESWNDVKIVMISWDDKIDQEICKNVWIDFLLKKPLTKQIKNEILEILNQIKK